MLAGDQAASASNGPSTRRAYPSQPSGSARVSVGNASRTIRSLLSLHDRGGIRSWLCGLALGPIRKKCRFGPATPRSPLRSTATGYMRTRGRDSRPLGHYLGGAARVPYASQIGEPEEWRIMTGRVEENCKQSRPPQDEILRHAPRPFTSTLRPGLTTSSLANPMHRRRWDRRVGGELRNCEKAVLFLTPAR
jgi:hypothetical protein